MYAFNNQDPASDDESALLYHGSTQRCVDGRNGVDLFFFANCFSSVGVKAASRWVKADGLAELFSF